MRIKCLSLYLCLVCLSIVAPGVEAATKYLSTTAVCTGNYSIAGDNCTGTDGDSFNSWTTAIAALTAGDTLYVRTSSRTLTASQSTTWPTTATVTNRITIAAYPDEVVTLTKTAATHRVIQPAGAVESYLTFQGFVIDGTGTLSDVIKLEVAGGTYPNGIWIIGNEPNHEAERKVAQALYEVKK